MSGIMNLLQGKTRAHSKRVAYTDERWATAQSLAAYVDDLEVVREGDEIVLYGPYSTTPAIAAHYLEQLR